MPAIQNLLQQTRYPGHNATMAANTGAQPKKKITSAATGVIKRTCVLIDEFSKLHLNEEISDVTIIVDGHKFHAHKFVLSLRSPYFKNMFSNGWRECAEKEVYLSDSCAEAFDLLLYYIYAGKMELSPNGLHLTMKVLALAHKYEFPVLLEQISIHLEAILNQVNLNEIFSAALLYTMDSLIAQCITFFDANKYDIVKNKIFDTFSVDMIETIVKEIRQLDHWLQEAFVSWIETNREQIEMLRPVLKKFKMEVFNIDDEIHLMKSVGVVIKKDIARQ